MTDYELFHLSMKCIGVGFLLFMAALVILSAISKAPDSPNDDGDRM